MFEFVRGVHVVCVSLAGLLFLWRGWLVWRHGQIERRLWRRTLPDGIDTLLLVSGATLAALLGQYPWQAGWLMLKLALVLLYIALGFLAFRPLLGRRLRLVCWLLALTVFASIVEIARLHEAGMI